MEKTILVAIDGSVHCGNSLEYLGKLFGSDPGIAFHLLSVATGSGGGKEWMLDVDPLRGQTPETDQRVIRARKHLRNAEKRLVRHGVSQERITTGVRTATSISGTIRDEAERGHYDSAVVGRRGLGAIGNMFFGSVSVELIEKCHKTPLWIVDGHADTERFLLAVHPSPSSLLAADHLAHMLKNLPSTKVCLYHSNPVFGTVQAAKPEAFHAQWGKDWCDKYLDRDNFLFYAHCQVLVEGGIPRHRIIQLPTQMHLDVSSDLLRQAKQHGCGTIVIGRRRRDLNKGQLKGVSDKTLKRAQNIAVYLAG
jgi:nucleotide-binding universal stress UspA family protein